MNTHTANTNMRQVGTKTNDGSYVVVPTSNGPRWKDTYDGTILFSYVGNTPNGSSSTGIRVNPYTGFPYNPRRYN